MALIISGTDGQLWQLDISPDGTQVLTPVTQGTESAGVSPYCTISLQNVVDWARTQTKLIPIVGVGGFNNEPALTICNNVIQEMLAAPFNWKFNRVEADPFTTVEYQQDYPAFLGGEPLTNIGWLESAIREDTNSTSPVKPREPITCVQQLQLTSDYGLPQKLSYLYRPDGSVIWRVWPIPVSQPATIYPVYQRKAPLKIALTDYWNPIPDEYAYVYRQGFLAMAFKHADDPRADAEYMKFQAMIQKALGISDIEQNDEIFYPSRPILLG